MPASTDDTNLNITYPDVRRDEDEVFELHGKTIKEPYIWLEDPDSEETKKFVKDQNDVTLPYLNKCDVKQKYFQR